MHHPCELQHTSCVSSHAYNAGYTHPTYFRFLHPVYAPYLRQPKKFLPTEGQPWAATAGVRPPSAPLQQEGARHETNLHTQNVEKKHSGRGTHPRSGALQVAHHLPAGGLNDSRLPPDCRQALRAAWRRCSFHPLAKRFVHGAAPAATPAAGPAAACGSRAAASLSIRTTSCSCRRASRRFRRCSLQWQVRFSQAVPEVHSASSASPPGRGRPGRSTWQGARPPSATLAQQPPGTPIHAYTALWAGTKRASLTC